ncbi:MAG TPA: class I adenylate-forming enzyme family protein [Micromonosporaceae bacterium]
MQPHVPAVPAPQPFAPDLLRLRAANSPHTVPLLIDGAPGLTYQEWDLRSNAVAHGLLAKGVRRGDRVALFFAGMDWSDYAVAYLAVLKAGGVAVHLNDELPSEELRRRLGHAAASGMIHSRMLVPPGDFVGWTGTVDQFDIGDEAPVAVRLDADDIADLLYTSGTTGPAKPFLNPHGNLAFGRGLGEVAKASFDPGSPLLMPMPLGTSSSAGTVGIFALTTTAPIVVCPAEDVERVAELIERMRIGSVMLTPWLGARMVASRVDRRYDLSSVTTIGVASGALPAPAGRALLTLMPKARIRTAYGGGSEAVPANISNVWDPDRPNCLGRPSAATELLVVDENDVPVPPGVVGEVWLRTAAPRRRYLDDRLTEQIHVDGWVRTRDLGYLGPDGELYFFDRGSDAIHTPQGLVSSLAVEAALYEHPDVREAAVVGVGDPRGGQAIHAVVVLAASELGEPDLGGFAAARLRPHEVPAAVHVVSALPRGTSGKVLKAELRRRLATGEGAVAG